MEPRTAPSNELSRHLAFARRLAHALVGPSRADDLVQEAWLAVLRRPPRRPEGFRAYLTTVLRRTAGRARRSEERRLRREERAARPEALPSSAELSQAMELHARIVRELAELPEAVRHAILLRFLDDLPPAEIARRAGVPVETVRTRIKRGLATLRGRLDGLAEDRRAWSATLLPLAGSTPPPEGTTTGPLAGPIGATLMATKAKLAIVGVAAVTAAVLWRTSSPPAVLPSSENEARGRGAAHPVAAREVDVPPPDGVGEATPAERARVEAPAAGTGVGEASPTVPERSVALAVTVRELDGDARSSEDGRIVLARDGNRRQEHQLPIVGGRSTLEGELLGTTVRVRRLELGGRMAYADLELYRVPESGTLSIEARWPRASSLRVVDAESGRDLDDVRLLRGRLRTRNALHPGTWTEENVVVEGVSSPFEVPAGRPQEPYWVHAPGYVWSGLTVDHLGGGERVVALEPRAAALSVLLNGHDPEANLELQLFPEAWDRAHGALATVRGPDEDVVRFEGLPPGRFQVRASIGNWNDGPIELARTTVDLLPGSVAEVSLDLGPAAELEPTVALSGRLVLPAGLERTEFFGLVISPTSGPPLRVTDRVHLGAGELIASKDDPHTLRFDAGEVTPGRYVVLVSDWQLWREIEVDGREVEVRLPELGEVRLSVVEAGTRRPLALDSITWGGPAAPGIRTWTLASVDPDPESGLYRFHAPLQRIHVDARWDHYDGTMTTVDVGPGVNEAVLEVRPRPGAWLRLVDGDVTVPLEWSVPVEARALEGEGQGRRSHLEDGRGWLDVDAPGLYEVTVGPVPGFLEVPAQTVEIGYGEADELLFRLERER